MTLCVTSLPGTPVRAAPRCQALNFESHHAPGEYLGYARARNALNGRTPVIIEI